MPKDPQRPVSAARPTSPKGGGASQPSAPHQAASSAYVASTVVSPCAAFLRPKAVTAHYGIHRSSLYRALAEGKIKAVKAGRTVLIDGESVRAYLASLPPAVFRAPRQ
jgi:excisionase family DNA binding protein